MVTNKELQKSSVDLYNTTTTSITADDVIGMVNSVDPQETPDAWSGHKRTTFINDLARELYLEHCKQRQGKAPQNYAEEVVRAAKELADALELED